MSRRTARSRAQWAQLPREWYLLPSGWDVNDSGDHRGWRCYTNSVDEARRAFGLATSTMLAVAA